MVLGFFISKIVKIKVEQFNNQNKKSNQISYTMDSGFFVYSFICNW